MRSNADALPCIVACLNTFASGSAQESLLKLLTGMNNDTNPLNFRDETER